MCALPGKAVPEMIYTVLGGMLNPTHFTFCAVVLVHTVSVCINYIAMTACQCDEATMHELFCMLTAVDVSVF